MCKRVGLLNRVCFHIPINPIFLAEMADGSNEVLDGLQRLTALRDFINGALCLTEVIPELYGKTFNDLSTKQQLDFCALCITLHTAENLSEKALIHIYNLLNGF